MSTTDEVRYYDDNGNLRDRNNGGGPDVLVLFDYTYDDENRLTFMEYDDYGTPYYQRHQLIYDGLGRVRQMVEYRFNEFYQEWQLAAERSSGR